MKPAMILVALIVAGMGLGWFTASLPEAPSGDTGVGLSRAGELRHGGEALAAAARRLSVLGLGRAPSPTAEETPPDIAPTAYAGPPTEDISAVFRRDLTAIEQTPAGPVAWIVDLGASRGRRGVAKGGEYIDGWRIADIDQQSVELRRGADVRRVHVFEPTQEP